MSQETDTTERPPPGRAYEVLTPGEKFGDYQILKCLSYDLLGSFYRVRKTREQEERTLFVLPPLVGGDAKFRQRFEEMTSRLKELDHSRIFPVSDATIVKERFTLFSDDFDGRNIADHLEAHALAVTKQKTREKTDELVADQAIGLPPDEVRSIFSQVLEALAYAHEHRILHLNLNPTNILRSRDGNIRVAGFGLMTMAGKALFETLVSAGIPPISLGPRRIRINTVDILSPEARLGKPGDHRSDIYAIGLTTYWMLTGRKPTFDYKPPSDYVQDLEPGWDMIVAKCLERDPEKRYQSATAVLKDLNRLHDLHLRPVPEEAGTRETSTLFKHIDFIPVPRRIQERGLLYARAFRLGVIGLFGLVLAFLVTSFYTLVFYDDDAGSRPVAVKTAEGRAPRLAVAVSPPSASLRFTREELGFITREGEFKLNVLPGTYRVEISAPQHQTERLMLEIGRDPVALSVVLKPDWATVAITTTPGARATATDRNGVIFDLGTADEEGSLRIAERLYTGTYTLTLSKPGYETLVHENVDMAGGGDVTSASFPLTPLPGTLRLRSEPQGADIIINDAVIGQTNFTAEDLPVLEPFLVTLRKPGYRDKTLSITLQPNVRTPLDFGELIREHGILQPVLSFEGKPATQELLNDAQFIVQSTTPWWNERVAFNGALYTPENIELKNVPAGEISLSIRHPDYITLERRFTLQDNALLRLPLNLTFRPGVITLSPSPSGLPLTLTVNNRSRDLGDSLQFSMKPNETYELEISAPDHLPLRRTLRLSPGERFTWDATLTPMPGPQIGQPYTVPYADIAIVPIPAGTFSMGSPLTEPSRLPEEGPDTRATLSSPFWMSRTEITQQQYQQVTGHRPSRFTGAQNPVDSVTWRDAMAFARKLNEQEAAAGRLPKGYEYRLPTEAEWEYAARAGTRTPFHWGDTASPANANFRGEYPRDFTTAQITETRDYGTRQVSSYPPNAFGLYDMHGNVREWCLDYYNARLPGGEVTDWVQTSRNDRRVIRGGGWEDFAIRSRAASRSDGQRENTPSSSTGFRIVLGPIITQIR